MATFYIGPSGNDLNSSATAQVEGTPWRTLQKAYDHCKTLGSGQIIDVLDGTWDLAANCNFLASGTAPVNLTIRIRAGKNPKFRILTGTGVSLGSGSSATRGQIWHFKTARGLLWDIEPGASITFEDYEDATHIRPSTGTQNAAGGMGKYTSAVYFTDCQDVIIRGKYKVSEYFGNGIMFKDSQRCHIEPDSAGNCADIRESMTGIRIENCQNAASTTTLSVQANPGHTTITVNAVPTGGPFNLHAWKVGDRINMGTGVGAVSWRRITGIAGNVISLGEGPYPLFPLEKTHNVGTTVRKMLGVEGSLTGEMVTVANTHHTLRHTVGGGGDDAGAMSIALTENVSDTVVARVDMFDAWCPSHDFGVDGGGWDFYNNPLDSRCYFTEGWCHDLHSPFELGTAGSGDPLNPTNNNGNWRYSFNVVYGQTDMQHMMGLQPGAPLMLARANPYMEYEFNTLRPINGNEGAGGIQMNPGSANWAGTYNNMTIRSNCFDVVYSGSAASMVYGSDPPGLTWNYNFINILNDSDVAINRNYGSPQDFACTATGLSSFRSTTPWGDNDIWHGASGLVLATNPFSGLVNKPIGIAANSPLVNASHKGVGYAIGAFPAPSAGGNALAQLAVATGVAQLGRAKLALSVGTIQATGVARAASAGTGGARLTIRMGFDEASGGGGGGSQVPPNPISGLAFPRQTMWRPYWENTPLSGVQGFIADFEAMNQNGVILMGMEWGNSYDLPLAVSSYLDLWIAAGITPYLGCWVGQLSQAEADTVERCWDDGDGKWAGIVLDAEGQWKNNVSADAAAAQIAFDAFMARVRPLTDELAYSTYGVPTFHEDMMYEWWNEACDFCLAQIYFSAPAHTADFILDRAMASWATISNGWPTPLKPIIPTGNAYAAGADPVERQAYGERALAERGHVSWWRHPIENPAVASVIAAL